MFDGIIEIIQNKYKRIKANKELDKKIDSMPEAYKEIYENINRGIPVNALDAIRVISYMEGE